MKRMMMFAIVCALALGVTSPLAASPLELNFGDARYIGVINPGGGSPATETGYLATLLDPTKVPLGSVNLTVADQKYTRTNYLCGGVCPTDLITATDADKKDGIGNVASYTVDVAGYAYVLGKYDAGNAGTAVWFVGNLPVGVTEVSLPGTMAGNNGGFQGLSHVTRVKATTTNVPDGGMTLMLLGGALVGLESLRRRYRG